MSEKRTDALERLNRGIQESRQEVQRRTMSLAQEYFGDSADALERQISENRDALKGLPDQIPGGREEAFQTMFQELMDNYTAMERCIDTARQNVADLDTDSIRRQGEVDATDAARRDAKELGIDLTEIEGTGSEGRVTVDDVKNFAETIDAGDAAGQVADQASGQAQQIAGRATDQAGELAGQAQGGAGQAVDQAGQVAGQAQQAVGQATGQAGQVAQGAQDLLGGAAGQAGRIADQSSGGAGDIDEIEDIDASDAAKREAREKGIDLTKVKGTGAKGRIVYWDVADLPPQTEEADVGQVAGGVADQADGAVGQAGGVASQIAEQAIGAAGQTADLAGQTARQGAESIGDHAQGNGSRSGEEEPKITKAAKRKAEEMGVDLSQIRGSGAGGLITIKDVVDA